MQLFQDFGKSLENIFQLIEDAGTSDIVNRLAGILSS